MFTVRVGACRKGVRACNRSGKVPSMTSLGPVAWTPCHHGQLGPAFRSGEVSRQVAAPTIR